MTSQPASENAATAAKPVVAPAVTSLSDDLGWILGTIGRRYLGIFTEHCPDLAGGLRGYQVLLAASDQACGNQLRLAESLGIDRTVMTYLIDELESSGLVERRPDPRDRRAKTLTVTAAGQKALKRGAKAAQIARDRILSELPTVRAELLGTLLLEIVHAEPAECEAARTQAMVDGTSS